VTGKRALRKALTDLQNDVPRGVHQRRVRRELQRGAALEVAQQARQPRQAGVAPLAAQARAANRDAADGLQRRSLQRPLQHGAGGEVQRPAAEDAGGFRAQGIRVYVARQS
jgi:hypothetical protein